MNRRILLPTDFSRNAWRAITYAQELNKNESCNFYILNVFSATGNPIVSLISLEPGSELYETARLKSENGLAKILDKLTLEKNQNPKHHFEVISKFNNTIEAIKAAVEEKDIDMIVMGSKGETESIKAVFGSVAIDVMEKVRNCPVIVVPELAKNNLPKEIVFPTSFKTHLKRRELKHLIELAQSCKASVKFLHIKTEEKLNKVQVNNKKLLEEYFENVDHSFHELSHNDIFVAINCFVESRDSDMVAFINKKHAFFGSILTKPLVKEIGYASKVPLLVMHDLRN